MTEIPPDPDIIDSLFDATEGIDALRDVNFDHDEEQRPTASLSRSAREGAGRRIHMPRSGGRLVPAERGRLRPNAARYGC
jgi:hypothetical protein